MQDMFLVFIIAAWLIHVTWWAIRVEARSAALHHVASLPLAHGDRIGWAVACDDEPFHTLVATALGTNKVTPHVANFALNSKLAGVMARRIRDEGWTGVDLAQAEIAASDFARFIDLYWRRWTVLDERLLARLRDELGLKAVIVARPAEVRVVQQAGDMGGEWFGCVAHTGLAQWTATWPCQSYAVLACEWHVFWLDPPCDLLLPALRPAVLPYQASPLHRFDKVFKLDELDDERLVRLQACLLEQMEQGSNVAAQCLLSRASPGPRPRTADTTTSADAMPKMPA
jgi:hypothetical protein